MLARVVNDRMQEIEARLHACGQGHVLRFWRDLAAQGRSRLEADLADVQPEALRAQLRAAQAAARAALPCDLEPPSVARHPERGGDAEGVRRARDAGASLVAEGRVAVLTVAGGQGSRLGHPGPKGSFPLGPVSGRSLFGLHAQKLRGLCRRSGARVPWLVMTSPSTDWATRRHFRDAGWFGLPREDVIFFSQQELPCLDFEGNLILEAPDRLARAPDGHGGVLQALASSGALDALSGRGIEVISYGQVDNPLLPLGDPFLLGEHRLQEAEWTVKVVAKQDPDEGVGTLARRGGRLRMVEYTELREPARSARDEAGELVFWAGSIGAHALGLDFLRRMGEALSADASFLPAHASAKRIPSVDSEGRTRVPEKPNGFKLERFVFDALPEARKTAAVEVLRQEEYAPLKNARGDSSPETARKALGALVCGWLEEAGVAVPGNGETMAVELDHAVAEGPDEIRAQGWRRASDAGDAIRIATGVSE